MAKSVKQQPLKLSECLCWAVALCPIKERSLVALGVTLKHHVISKDQKIHLFSDFCLWTKTLQKEQTCLEYCRLWVRVIMQVSSIFVLKKKTKTLYNRFKGMKLQEKQKYFFNNLHKAVFECQWSSAYKDLHFFLHLVKDTIPQLPLRHFS